MNTSLTTFSAMIWSNWKDLNICPKCWSVMCPEKGSSQSLDCKMRRQFLGRFSMCARRQSLQSLGVVLSSPSSFEDRSECMFTAAERKETKGWEWEKKQDWRRIKCPSHTCNSLKFQCIITTLTLHTSPWWRHTSQVNHLLPAFTKDMLVKTSVCTTTLDNFAHTSAMSFHMCDATEVLRKWRFGGFGH